MWKKSFSTTIGYNTKESGPETGYSLTAEGWVETTAKNQGQTYKSYFVLLVYHNSTLTKILH